jgi:hypothetical protein
VLCAALAGSGCKNNPPPKADTAASVRSDTPRVATAPAPLRRPSTTKKPTLTGTTAQSSSTAKSLAPPAESGSVQKETTRVAPTTQVAAPAPVSPAPAPGPSPTAIALSHLPFANGERLEYQVKYGFLGVGSATLEVLGLDTVRGTPAVHASFIVKGGVRIYRVNDSYESWFDPRSFSTLRAIQNIDEGSYDRQRDFEFFPERRMLSENGKPETPTVADPLDEASFLFFLRSIPLEVGQTYEFARYFRPEKNPVRVIVERKERVKVPAGQFDAIVVRPVIRTSGIFGEGGRAEVWFTGDSTRTLLQLKSQLKFGSLNLYLRNRRVGRSWDSVTTTAVRR